MDRNTIFKGYLESLRKLADMPGAGNVTFGAPEKGQVASLSGQLKDYVLNQAQKDSGSIPSDTMQNITPEDIAAVQSALIQESGDSGKETPQARSVMNYILAQLKQAYESTKEGVTGAAQSAKEWGEGIYKKHPFAVGAAAGAMPLLMAAVLVAALRKRNTRKRR